MSVPITSPGSIEIEQQIADREKELQGLLKLEQIASQEKLTVERAIIDLQGKRKDLSIALGQARHTRRQKELEIKLLTGKFWATKKAGQ
jgi:hypothetical protein